MTLLYTDPLFLRHETGPHPERPDRLRTVTARLAKSGVAGLCAHGEYQPMSEEEVKGLHDPPTGAVRQAGLRNRAAADSTATRPSARNRSRSRWRRPAPARRAVDAVIGGKDRNALCLVRPPGHHATPTTSMGFCLFNNVALAAQRARKVHGLTRILIVDWDVHHGNGTQDIFYADPEECNSSASTATAVLPRHRRRRRDGDRTRPRPHPQRADPLRHLAAGLPRRVHVRPGEGGRRDQAGAGAARAPASTPTPPTRSARSGWKSRTSRR